MRVICTRNTSNATIARHRRAQWLSPHCEYGDLTIGAIYTVFGLWVRKAEFSYGIGSRGHAYPSELFEVVDPRCSRHWELGRPVIDSVELIVLSYSDLVRDYVRYYSALIDKDERTSAVHAQWLMRLENEFHHSDLVLASILEGNWLQCPHCSDAWQADMEGGVVTCPKCGTRLNNPLAPSSASLFAS